MPTPARAAFAALVQRPDAEIDLVEAALLLAQEVYPSLDAAACRRELDALAAQVREQLAADEDPPSGQNHAPRATHHASRTLAALQAVLFGEAGFHGNSADYYDPRNSYLNEVLARRTGIPITLALVTIAVGARVGVRLHGIGLPGHFLVGYRPPEAALASLTGARFFDPFHGGRERTVADCAAVVRGVFGADAPFPADWLVPVGPRAFLSRMLTNLQAIYLDRQDWPAALRVVDTLLLLQPDALYPLRLRGLLAIRSGALAAALADLQQYLRRAPDAADAAQVGYQIALLQRLRAARN